MAEVLSQSQIDDLLRSINSGDVQLDSVNDDPKKRVKEYDFRSPKRFTREQIKIIDSVYQNYARRLASYLSGILRVYCEASVVQIEEQKYYEFNNALADSVLMTNINVQYPEDEGVGDQTLLMEISKSISFSIVDRMLGGNGEGYNYSRDYTEIELSVLENLLKQIIVLMKEPWSSYFTIEPKLERIETNSRLIQAMDADETVLLIIINLKVKQLEGMINVCMPGSSLMAILNQLAEKDRKHDKNVEVDERERQSIMMSVEEGDLEIQALLGKVNLSLADVLTLHVGDVIELDHSVDSPVTLMVKGNPWFSGTLGVKKRKKAVKIIDYYEKRGKL